MMIRLIVIVSEEEEYTRTEKYIYKIVENVIERY